jgi:cytochrome c oxidase subunit 2
MNELLRQLLFLPDQASTFARRVDFLHYFVILTTLVMSTLVGMTAIYFFIRYRRRFEGQRTPHVETRPSHEALFIGVPLATFLLWFAIGYTDYVHGQGAPPPNAMDVYVMAKQWMWEFAYPEGPNSISTLRVPLGRPVRVLITSRDVVHSFYVPAFRLKMDALPGRYTEAWFEATQEGRFEIFCAEYCGGGHSTMRAEIVVMKADEFDEWMHDSRRGLADRQDGLPTSREEVSPAANLITQGKSLAATYGCFKCHSVDGTQHIGPTWLDLYRRRTKLQDGTEIIADEAYLTESMMDPRAKLVAGYQNVMPSFQGRLAAPEVAALVEFIKTLRTETVLNQPAKGPIYEPARLQ